MRRFIDDIICWWMMLGHECVDRTEHGHPILLSKRQARNWRERYTPEAREMFKAYVDRFGEELMVEHPEWRHFTSPPQ